MLGVSAISFSRAAEGAHRVFGEDEMAGKSRIEWGKELVQFGSEMASLTAGVGVPGISVIAKFAEEFYKEFLLFRLAIFCGVSVERIVTQIIIGWDFSTRGSAGRHLRIYTSTSWPVR